MIREGETYALPRDWDRARSLAYWFTPGRSVFVAEDQGAVLGTYFLQANKDGGGSHVANCGYVTAPAVRGRGHAVVQELVVRVRGIPQVAAGHVGEAQVEHVQRQFAAGAVEQGQVDAGCCEHQQQEDGQHPQIVEWIVRTQPGSSHGETIDPTFEAGPGSF